MIRTAAIAAFVILASLQANAAENKQRKFKPFDYDKCFAHQTRVTGSMRVAGFACSRRRINIEWRKRGYEPLLR